jgi:glycosyltransferase involved in cell wall biosynthesis
VLIATDDTTAGGTAQVAFQIAAALGGEFDIRFAGRRNAATAGALDELALRGVTFHPYEIDEGAPWRNPLQSLYATDPAVALLEACDPDLLVTFDAAELFSSAALKSAAARCGVPHVSVINILLDDVARRFGPMFDRLVDALSQSEAIVFACEAHFRRFKSVLPDNPAPKLVIPNCRPDRFFERRDPKARERLRKELKLPADAFVCLTTARIEPHKGQTRIVQGLASLQKRGLGDPVHLVFAGGGTTQHVRELEREVTRFGLAEHVHALGPRADVVDLLDASDIFILPSKSEATSLSIIEAMAKGLPVVATGVDGILELIDEGCGILLPLEDEAAIDAIADAIERLRRDPLLRIRLAEAGRSRADAFRIERAAPRYAALIRDLLDRRGARAPGRFERSIVPIGATVDLADPAVAWNILQDGWSVSETEGVWSCGPTSTLSLRTNARRGETLRLDFEITPHLARSWPSQDSYVFANDVPIAFWHVSTPGRQRRSLFVEVGDDEGRVRLRFEHVRAVSPAALGDSQDPRELALFFHGLTVAIAARDELAA